MPRSDPPFYISDRGIKPLLQDAFRLILITVASRRSLLQTAAD